jgi:hypothetical protein
MNSNKKLNGLVRRLADTETKKSALEEEL